MNSHPVIGQPPLSIPLAILVSGILGVTWIGLHPITTGEFLMVPQVSGSVSQVLASAAASHQLPLWQLLTSLVAALWAGNPLSLRIVTLVAGIGFVSLVPTIVRRLKVDPIVSTWIGATVPLALVMSVAANSLGLLLFLAAASSVTLLRLWEDPVASERWIAWGGLVSLLLLTHPVGWIILGGQLLATLWFARGIFNQTWNWVGAVVMITAAYLPVLNSFIK